MGCLNVSQNVTRKTFKITRTPPTNNPQTHQESGVSDVASCSCGRSLWNFQNVESPQTCFMFTICKDYFCAGGVLVSGKRVHEALPRFSPFRIWRVSFPVSPNGGFWNDQRVTPYQQKSTSTVKEIVMVAGGLRHHHGDDAVQSAGTVEQGGYGSLCCALLA